MITDHQILASLYTHFLIKSTNKARDCPEGGKSKGKGGKGKGSPGTFWMAKFSWHETVTKWISAPAL